MGRHVVLVEDEPNITEAIRFLLTRDGWQVDSHADGSDAVEVICAAKPDLVILDLMLPGKSGLEIIRELRESARLPGLPVLMLTARGQLRDREMAEQAGVTRFMTKPFSNNEVLTAVRDLHAQAAQNRAKLSDAAAAAAADLAEQARQG
ncbi:response regulator [Phaeobacter sp. JH20_36]|uniref:response regulator transcription factor n=1 Tax=Phaeobacter TaxID=302485 RepID=UPI0030C91450